MDDSAKNQRNKVHIDYENIKWMMVKNMFNPTIKDVHVCCVYVTCFSDFGTANSVYSVKWMHGLGIFHGVSHLHRESNNCYIYLHSSIYFNEFFILSPRIAK